MRRLFDSLNQLCSKRFFPLLFLPLAFSFLLFFAESTSPIFINDGEDSAIFKTIGLGILRGRLLYVDIFDHKGPILFFINAFAQWVIPGRLGLFLLEVISLSVTLFYIFKTARLYVKAFPAFISSFLSLCLMGALLSEGDQCEEWCLPFFAIPLYHALAYLSTNRTDGFPPKWGFLTGICFGITFFIRPNDAVGFLGGIMTGLMLLKLYQKQFKNVLANVGTFAAGTVLVAIPVIVYFGVHDAIDDLIYGTLMMNVSYSGGIKETLASCFGHLKLCLSLLLLAILVSASVVKKETLIVFIPLCAFVYYLMGPRMYHHYLIILIPLFSLLFAFSFSLKNPPVSILAVAILLLCPQSGTDGLLKQARKATVYRLNLLKNGQQEVKRFYQETDALIDLIPENERDQIWQYNLGWDKNRQSTFSMLIHKNIVYCNKVAFGTSDKLIEEDDIRTHSPKWLLKDNRMTPLWERMYLLDPDRLEYIDTHFDLVARTDTTICDVSLYRWKDL